MIRSSVALRLRSIPSPPLGAVKQGYGDYIFAKKEARGRLTPISLSEYKQIYPVTKEWMHQPSVDVLSEKIQKVLGNHVFPIFIPNTLYGLYFIEECIRERVRILEKTKGNFSSLSQVAFKLQHLTSVEELQTLKEQNGDWALCHYSNPDYLSERISDAKDFRSFHLSEVSGLLNERIVRRLVEEEQLSSEGLVYEQIQSATNTLMKFHKEINDGSHPNCRKIFEAILLEMQQGTKSFLAHFCPFSGYEFAVDIGNNPKAGKILHNSIRLECSPEVEGSAILYRGTRNLNESLIDPAGYPLSLSLGSRLLAGCIHDGGAMALSYGAKPSREMLAFIIPKKTLREERAAFFVPEASSLEQFYSAGEGFHARTVVPHEMIDSCVFGSIFMRNKERVGSSQSIEEIDRIFQEHLKSAVCLSDP